MNQPDDAPQPPTIIDQPAGASAPEMSAPTSGADNYVLGAEIARGGMGAVLEAEDTKLRRTVAAKLMFSDEDADAEMRRRFVREAEVLALLAHPNIVPVYDIVWEGGAPLFYTMKRVNGRTLQAILHDLRKEDAAALRDFTLDRLLLIFRKVCDALAFAHSKGVIHRDLKPENVMIGEFGEVLVMDWGIAKVLGDEHRTSNVQHPTSNESAVLGATMQGSVMGTPQYMSPEQARGEIDALDQRSDIFSLGGILYAILTLRPPVEGATLEDVLKKVIGAQITSPSALQASSTAKAKAREKGEVIEAKLIKPLPHVAGGRVPAALSSVAMTALRLDKAQRYQSVAELSADIEAYQAGFATKAEHAGLAKQLVLLIKRNKGIFTTAAAAWLLITALAVWFIINLRAKERRALAGEQTALVEKETARRSAAKASLSLAEASLREANGLAMQTALNDVPDDLRDTTWSYLLAQSDSSIARLRTGAEAIEGVAADPTRPGVFAVADRDGKVAIVKVRTGERLLEFRLGFADARGGTRYRIAFSPDGRHIAAGRARNVWDPDGPGGLVLHRASDGIKEKEWETPSTERLEFGRNDALLRQGSRSLQVWNPITGQLWWEEKIANNIGVKGTFTPGGNEVVKFTTKNRLQLVKAHDGSVIRELGGRNSSYDWFMAVRPDGKAVVTWNEKRVTECVSLEDGRTLFALPDKKMRHHVGFSHDGAMLFTAALRDEGVQSIEVWNAQTGEWLRALLGGQGQITGLGTHPVSRELLVAGPDSRVWDTTGPAAPWRVSSLSGGNIAFWGPEDWVFGFVSTPLEWGLHRLQRDGLERLWQYDSKTAALAETSADGSLAIAIRPGWSNDVALLRKTGTNVERVKTFTANIRPFRVRPSPKGSRVVLMERVNHLGLQVYDTAGKVAVKLDRANLQRISDIGWLSEQRLLGLLTLDSGRGNPGSRECIVVWDAGTGRVLQNATHPTAMDALAIAPDGRRFAEAGADKLVRIRDATTLAVQQQFRAHDAPITVLAWHPTQPIIATGSEDLSIKVWNFETGRLLTGYHDLLNPPDQLVFSPTGRFLAARTNPDLVGRIWQIEGDAPALAKPAPSLPVAAAPTKAPIVDGWEDLLAALTPALAEQSGSGWRMDKGVLFSSTKPEASLLLSGNYFAASYQLRVKLRRLEPRNLFYIALPVGDRKVGFALDAHPNLGYYTGLSQVDGKATPELPGAVPGLQIRDSELHEIELTVRPAGGNASVTATLDRQPLYVWSGPIASLSQFGHRAPTPPGSIAFSSAAADWEVHEVKVKRLEK